MNARPRRHERTAPLDDGVSDSCSRPSAEGRLLDSLHLYRGLRPQGSKRCDTKRLVM